MARKTFGVATEPHVAEIGDVELRFVPFVTSAEFLTAYEALREINDSVKRDENDSVSAADAQRIHDASKEFLASFMVPESAEVFLDMRLPDTVLGELTRWVNELYGGSGTRPTGSSSASPRRSSKSGKRSTAPSPSKGSTPQAGRSTD